MKISALALTAALLAAALPAQAADFALHPSQKPQQLNNKAPVQVINFGPRGAVLAAKKCRP